jgi:hypothetical protein
MQLKPRIERYLRNTRTAPTRFGRDAVGDPRFVFDLRNGREPREATRNRVQAWLDAREAGTCG